MQGIRFVALLSALSALVETACSNPNSEQAEVVVMEPASKSSEIPIQGIDFYRCSY